MVIHCKQRSILDAAVRGRWVGAKSSVHVASQPDIVATTMHSEVPIPLKCELRQTELGPEQKCPQALAVGGEFVSELAPLLVCLIRRTRASTARLNYPGSVASIEEWAGLP